MSSKLLLVLIPVYKETDKLCELEELSIKNTISKFKNSHSIGLLKSSTISLESYRDYFNFHFLDYQFPFSSWTEYNSLLKTKCFYEKLCEYHYLLIIQTDAFIFSSSLSEFYQYDYVGAPWQRNPLRFIKGNVGNGGFSLRNINKILAILKSKKRLFYFIPLLHLNLKHSYKYGSVNRVNGFKRFTPFQICHLFLKSLYQYLFMNSSRKAYLLESLMEDTLFGVLFPARFSSFKVPNVEIALQFSIDENPEYFYKLNGGFLPLGCHAFIKNYKIFWHRFI